jgi:hypothetical protein
LLEGWSSKQVGRALVGMFAWGEDSEWSQWLGGLRITVLSMRMV